MFVEGQAMLEDKKLEYRLIEEAFSYEAEVRRKGILCSLLLEEENQRFADSPGVSSNNREKGFVPAFQDTRSGCCRVSRFSDGSPAPIHVLDGLPDEWVEAGKFNGREISICPHIISGFLRNGRFYTREEASQAVLSHSSALT